MDMFLAFKRIKYQKNQKILHNIKPLYITIYYNHQPLEEKVFIKPKKYHYKYNHLKRIN